MNEESNSSRIYASRLVDEYHYPMRFVQENAPYSFGKARYRIDVLVLQEGKPYIVAETKGRPSLPETLDQLQGLLRATNAEFGVVTNGFFDSCYRNPSDSLDAKLHPIPDIPEYDKKLQDLGRHKNSELVKVSPERFREVIIHLAVDVSFSDWGRRQGLSTDESAKEIVKLVLLKIYDETLTEAFFRARYRESPENTRSRIVALATKAQEKYPILLKEPLKLSDQLLSMCVFSLQRFSLRDSVHEIPFDDLLSLSGHEFLTPRRVTKLMIDLLNPSKGSSFIDPACGAGGFVAEAARRGCRVTGIETNPNMAQYAQVNLALTGATGQILNANALGIGVRSSTYPESLSGLRESSFDFAAVDPPFGGRIDDNTLDNFDLGVGKKGQRTEALFLELTLRLLKPAGRMVMTVPEGFLFADSALSAREFVLREATVKAIVSLPKGALYVSPAKSSLLLLERSPGKGTRPHDPIFVAMLEDLKEAPRIVSAYRASQKGELERSKEYLVTRIRSARQMNAGFFLQSSNLEMREDERYPLIGLNEIANVTVGVRPEKIGSLDSHGKFYYVRAGNVEDFVIDLEKADKITLSEGHSEKAWSWLAKPGDILITRTGTVGRAALVTADSPPVLIGSNVAKISLRSSHPLPEFILAFLVSREGTRQVNMYTSGGTIESISTSSLRQIRIPLPPNELQEQVARQVRKIIEAKREEKRVLQDMMFREKQLRGELEGLLEMRQ